MFYDKDDDSGLNWIFVGVPVAVWLAIMFALMNPPPKIPPLKNELAFGCYSSNLAPPIRLDSKGMHILQPGFPTIPFHLERHKTGIALSADRPIQAKAINGGHAYYSFYQPGEGLYLDFFHVVNGQRYGVMDESELSAFTMVAQDTYLIYVTAPQSTCDTN